MRNILEIGIIIFLWWLVATLVRGARFRRIEGSLKSIEDRLGTIEKSLALPQKKPAPAPPQPQAAPEPAPQPGPTPPIAPQAAAKPGPVIANKITATPVQTASIASEPPSGMKAAADMRKPKDLETTLGSRWAVWVGGIALALGGLFLARYTIDEGLLGPELRLALALALGFSAMTVGEYLRRSERRIAIASIPSAHIPSILTSVGITITFGTIYAAYGLYAFIGPTTALLGLAATAVLALVASIAHGPALAALGLVGVYVTPILVGGSKPDYWTLGVYLAFATITSLALARHKKSTWIATCALASSGLWSIFFITARTEDAAGAAALHILFAPVLTAALSIRSLIAQRMPSAIDLDATRLAILIGLATATASVLNGNDDTLPIGAAVLICMVALGVWAAWVRPSWQLLISAASLAVSLSTATWPYFGAYEMRKLFRGETALPTAMEIYLTTAWICTALILLPALQLLFRGGERARARNQVYAWTVALAPVLILSLTALRLTGFSSDPVLAAIAILLSTGLYIAAELLRRRDTAPSAAPAFAAAASVALGLFCGFALPGGWLHVGLAIAAAAVAFISMARSFPVLAPFSSMLAAAAALRLASDPVIGNVGETPVLNMLVIAYGLPAIAFAVGAWALRRTSAGPRSVHEALAAIFGALFLVLEVRHFFHGPDELLGASAGFAETTSLVVALLGLTSLLARGGAVWGSVVIQILTACSAGLAVILAFWLLLVLNPLFDRSLVDGPVIFNRLLFGYGLTAAAFAGTAWIIRDVSIREVRGMLTASAWLLTAVTMLLLMRNVFHGHDISIVKSIRLDEGGAYLVILFGGTALFAWLGRRQPDAVWTMAAKISLYVAIVSAGLIQGLITNPLVTRDPLGDIPLMDASLLGYLIPGIAAALAAFLLKPQGWRAVAGMAALAFVFFYVMAQIRRAFAGPFIALGSVSSAESYTYSAAILIYGIVILGFGFWMRSREIRLASAVAIIAAVAKVFLFDMAALEGIWRALSFIGLGLVMIGIGLLYQRLLSRPDSPA